MRSDQSLQQLPFLIAALVPAVSAARMATYTASARVAQTPAKNSRVLLAAGAMEDEYAHGIEFAEFIDGFNHCLSVAFRSVRVDVRHDVHGMQWW
jgi:hypothetical protein